MEVAERSNCVLLLSGSLIEKNPTAADLLDRYLDSGTASFSRLRGRFAFIVVDRRERRALAVRDSSGAQPVFYALDRETLYIAPTAEIVARREGRKPVADRLAAAAFLVRTVLEAERTFFEGVRRLPQAHMLEVSDARTGARPYRSEHASSQGEAFERLALQAVHRSPGVRRGVLLSGGLDSALVTALAADDAQSRGEPAPVALSISFRGTGADEEGMQRTVAARLGLDQVMYTPEELLHGKGMLESALDLAGEGGAQPPDVLTAVYDALCRVGAARGCDAVLTGSGGDEWLMPPPGYAADRLRVLDVPAVAELARAWHDYWPQYRRFGSVRAVVLDEGVRPIVRSAAMRGVELVAPRELVRQRIERTERSIPRALLPDSDLRRRLAQAIVESDPFVPVSQRVEFERRRILDGAEVSAAQEMDRDFERRTGVLIDMPLLDPDLVQHLCELAPRRLVARGRAKALAREVLSRRLGALAGRWPRTVYANSFWAQTIRKEGARAWELSAGVDALAELGIVDPAHVRRVLTEPLDSTTLQDSNGAWRALTFDRWLRRTISPML
jgi:asparagine synthetase B (glutamine-hydrolysing)